MSKKEKLYILKQCCLTLQFIKEEKHKEQEQKLESDKVLILTRKYYGKNLKVGY